MLQDAWTTRFRLLPVATQTPSDRRPLWFSTIMVWLQRTLEPGSKVANPTEPW